MTDMQIRLAGAALTVAGLLIAALGWRREIRAHADERRNLRRAARVRELEAQAEWDALIAMMREDD